MTNQVDRFYAALTVLAGHGHIKQRLIKAYEDNLAEIQDDELPVTLKQSFADFRLQMQQVTPLNGESAVCASVRKMSLDEASACAASVVALYGESIRSQDTVQAKPPMAEIDETRVPPFLVKSV
ncbi:MAG: hypothetical protein K0U72_02620 [Gammaproteobacteria bacterium]|nr:hypothetical protein [Gammaproteobacteria bacterium]